MIGLSEIGSYIPENFISNFEKMTKFEVDEKFIFNKIGAKQVSRMQNNEETSDMCVKAFRNLQKKTNIDINEVDCIVVCTQNPDLNGIPHTSAILHNKLGAKLECPSFDISLGCSGYVYGLSIVKSFMESNNLKKGLFFTADPYSKIVDQNDKNTALLFGDAATVSLLIDTDQKIWQPRSFIFGTNGEYYNALNTQNGHLEMNGRAVFNFSATTVPKQVKQVLINSSLDINDIDLYIFHQGSKYILDTIKSRLKLPAEKVPIDLENQGNTISSSIPLIFEKYIDSTRIDKVIISGFGVGLSWATCLLEKIREE